MAKSPILPTGTAAAKSPSALLVLELPGLAEATRDAGNSPTGLSAGLAQQIADALQSPAGMGVPLSELTVAAAAAPTLDGSPHGVYFFILDGKVLYVGSTVGRTFHERLAAHLEPYANGWLNSCVKAMVAHRPQLYRDHAVAVQALVAQGRILFCPAGFCHGPTRQAQRKLIRQIENQLRDWLAPINKGNKAQNHCADLVKSLVENCNDAHLGDIEQRTDIAEQMRGVSAALIAQGESDAEAPFGPG